MENYINTNKNLWKKYDKFILWGAGDGGRKCYEWMKAANLTDKIDCFIDRSLYGKELFDKKINSPDYVREHNHAIIASTVYWPEVEEYLNLNNITNSFFVYFNMEIPYKIAPPHAHNVNEILSQYASDRYTADMVHFNKYIKDNGDNLILPVDFSQPIFQESHPDYWAVKTNSLGVYEAITLIDGGAYTGDSLAAIQKRTAGKVAKAYCFEPDPNNIARMKDFLKSQGLLDIATIIEAGMAEKCGKYKLVGTGIGANLAEAEDGDINVVSIDSLDLDVLGKLCIKMYIETFELAALRGAENTIKKYKPELAICVYHQASDIYEIPKYIKSLDPSYNCILRGGTHMVCYASVDRYKK
jgi:FkbM family methyltransferase